MLLAGAGCARNIVSRTLSSCALVLLLGACSDTSSRPPAHAAWPPPPPPQPPAGSAPAAAPSQRAAARPAAPDAVPPLGAVLADPRTLERIVTGMLAGTAASLSPLTGGERAPLEEGIRLRAENDARGMKPEGPLISARLEPDGHAATTLELAAGACYTFVGFGGPGVLGYEINLLTAPPLPPQVLAQSPRGAPHPTVGPNEQCIRHPYPLPMRINLDLHVVRGQGQVAARAYRK